MVPHDLRQAFLERLAVELQGRDLSDGLVHRVASKQELKNRIMAAIDHFNQSPVVHTWSYKLDKAA